MDSNGTRIDDNDLKIGNSEKSLTVSLNKSKLVSGFFVKWFVLSKGDGLITKVRILFPVSTGSKV